MKFIKLVVVALVFAYSVTGQNTNKFAGILTLQDTLVITYKIEFKESQGKIIGYSLTDYGGEHETKSRIEGIYDHDKRMLSFSEVDLIYTKSPVSLNDFDFCNVHLEPTKFKLGSNKLFGKFKGMFKDGTECISGQITMNSNEKITKRVSKISKKIARSKRIDDSIKDKFKNLKIIDTLNLNVLKKNEVTSIPTSSSKIKFYIYDGGQIDDDIISILKDDEMILSKHRISDKKEIVEININKDRTQLTILSESVGSIGSNTAIIEIFDNGTSIKTMTNLKKGETTKIDIIKRQ